MVRWLWALGRVGKGVTAGRALAAHCQRSNVAGRVARDALCKMRGGGAEIGCRYGHPCRRLSTEKALPTGRQVGVL